MTMFKLLILILGTCASISCSDPVRYVESLKEIKECEKIHTDVILSMAGNIPSLNDYRRHYAEIIHAIYHIATVLAYNCSVTDTGGLYDRLLDEGVTESITNITHVIEVVKQFIDDFNVGTDGIQMLINTKCASNITEGDCDEIIQDFVLNDPKKYAKEANLLLSAREYAKIFNRNSDTFKKLSQEMEAHKYVLTEPIELNEVVTALTKFIPVLYPNDSPCFKYV